MITKNLSGVGGNRRSEDEIRHINAKIDAFNRERAAASALYRAAHSSALDLHYGAGERAAWDIFPAADPAAPCLVFIHGEDWHARRQDFACVAEGIAAHGWSVALPGYDASPPTTRPEIIAQIRTALDWLQQHGPAHGIAGRVVIAGCNTGAYLASLLLNHPIVACGIGISGIYEPGPRRGRDIQDRPYPELLFPSPSFLPVVRKEFAIAYGTGDIHGVAESSRNLHAHRADHHGPGVLLPLPDADHYAVFKQLSDSASRLIWYVLDLGNSFNFHDGSDGG